MEVRFLGAHNTESRGTRMAAVVVDGVLALDAGGLTSGLSFEEQACLQALLLTHQHYDHVRDVPALAMNLFLRQRSIALYGPPEVRLALAGLLNGDNYPDFLEKPEGKPTLRFCPVKSGDELDIVGYSVLPIPVCHSVPSIGYEIRHAGKSLFYTGDTGPGINFSGMKADLIIVEVTSSARFEDFARESGHLTPALLEEELLGLQKLNGYLPKVVAVHLNPDLEVEIKRELAGVARRLGNRIDVAYEGLLVSV